VLKGWQCDGKFSECVLFGLHRNGAFVVLHDFVAEVESHTGSLGRGLRGEEGVEDLVDDGLLDTYAVVKKAGKLQNQGAYHPEITLHASVTGKQVTLKFHDNGIGIEETIIGKIFDPFFTTKTTGEAAGVGLYLCHEIVQNHGGTITVESEKDQYTEFTITLPTL
jgi:signal transduction histidine kinase